MIAIGLICSAAFAHGNKHVEHATVFHLSPHELRVDHIVEVPAGFLDLERLDATRRGIGEADFQREKAVEILSGLTLSMDGQAADRAAQHAMVETSASGDVVRVEWTVPWTAAPHAIEWGTANALDEASSFEATVDPGSAFEVVASTNADGEERHEEAARKVSLRVEPVSSRWGWGVGGGVVLAALVVVVGNGRLKR